MPPTTDTKTRYVVQFQGTLDVWRDNFELHTEPEARAMMAIEEKRYPTIKHRVVKRIITSETIEVETPAT